jgi:hypothetical protein
LSLLYFSIRWRLASRHRTGCVCDHLAATLVKNYIFTSRPTRQFFDTHSGCIHIAYRFHPDYRNPFDFEDVVAGSEHSEQLHFVVYVPSALQTKAIMLPQMPGSRVRDKPFDFFNKT